MAVRTGGEPIDQASLLAGIGQAIGGAVRSVGEWFGPGLPTAPVAPPEVRGRQLDYPQAFNVGNWKPRSEQGENGIDFQTLRALADPTQGGLDLLRIAIETRKDQMATQRWQLVGRDGSDGGDKARKIEQAMRFPDRVHTWGQWLRMILDDLLVIDAPTAYLAPSTLGYLVPQVMDGGTLKLLLAQDGRTPLPPDPCYQQTLKGLPAVDYTLDEIVQMPRNLRSHRIYGMSPVEQVVTTVSIALRRQESQLEYYTAGSIPDLVFQCPSDWNAAQIAVFQNYWDSLMSGNTEERRRARFVPSGVAPTLLKPEQLKDMFDEWLARIICYCFSLSPTALVKETNRATAETSKMAAQEEGLEPLKLWLKDFIDCLLVKAFNAQDLELAWADEEIADPQVKADVMATALGKGGGKPWLTTDEVRDKYGEQPMTDAQRAELLPAPVAPVAPDPAAGAAQDAKVKVELAEIQKRSAEPVLAVADGLKRIASAMQGQPRRSVEFKRDPTGAVVGAVLTEE
jgi:hypothetical protein